MHCKLACSRGHPCGDVRGEEEWFRVGAHFRSTRALGTLISVEKLLDIKEVGDQSEHLAEFLAAVHDAQDLKI